MTAEGPGAAVPGTAEGLGAAGTAEGPGAAVPGAAVPWAERSVITGADGITRCAWGVERDPIYADYHDREWGRPKRDGRHLFEMLILEGAQAGLSWSTILHRREGYRRAFAGFDPELIAAFDDADVARLLGDPGIVRNRLKVAAAIANAQATLALGGDGALGALLWDFVDGRPIDLRPQRFADVSAETPVSKAMSRDLARRGFRFVGPTICYAFMQACGMVNDHLLGCAAGQEIRA